MSLEKLCNKAGLSGPAELKLITKVPTNTLWRWQTTKPAALECLILGAAVKKERQK